MNITWILVASAAQARLFEQEPDHAPVLLDTFHHPASRLRASDLADDRAGRELSDQGFGGATLRPRLDPRRKEHQRFARELAQRLEQGVRQGRCDAVTVFAASPFLGELKQVLGEATLRQLTGAHAVDLSMVGTAEIARRIRDVLEQAH